MEPRKGVSEYSISYWFSSYGRLSSRDNKEMPEPKLNYNISEMDSDINKMRHPFVIRYLPIEISYFAKHFNVRNLTF